MSPKEHVKLLAERFMKRGAEDLWNHDDGPVHSSPKPDPIKPIDAPIDVRKYIKERNLDDYKNLNFSGNVQQKRGFCDGNLISLRGFLGNVQQKRGFCDWNLISLSGLLGNLEQKRGYSGKVKKKFNYNRNGSSSSDDDVDNVRVIGNMRWPQFTLEGGQMGSEDEGENSGVKSVRGFMGNATLGNYDVKVTKRRTLRNLEKYAEMEDQGSLTIEEIRQELIERKRAQETQVEETPEMSDQDEFVGSGKRWVFS